MKTKFFKYAMRTCAVVALTSALVACGTPTNPDEGKIKEVYSQYVANAEQKGEKVLSYEEWLASIKGETGAKGDKGDKGDAGAKGD
ncbi:MAG: hypothetical protein RSE56_03645, partial [Bacilli bacterium]